MLDRPAEIIVKLHSAESRRLLERATLRIGASCPIRPRVDARGRRRRVLSTRNSDEYHSQLSPFAINDANLSRTCFRNTD
jgi:hypothetical protein